MSEIDQEEVRRIQLTGRSSYIITLPKRWVDILELKKGDSISISQRDDDALILRPRKSHQISEKKEIEANISLGKDLESDIRKIISFYLVGFNTIQLRSKNERLTLDQREYIKDNIRTKLVGSEIITESQDTMTIQVLLSYSELTVVNALRRMFAIAKSMHIDAIGALKDLDKNLAGEIVKMDDEVDRFSFFIIRQLKLAIQNQSLIKEIGLNDPRDILGYRLTTKSIERIADHASNIARNILTLENEIKPEFYSMLLEMSSFASILFTDVEKAFFSLNYGLAEKVLKKGRNIISMEKKTIEHLLEEKLSPNDLSKLRIILESIRRIAEYGTDIAEIVLNLTVIKVSK